MACGLDRFELYQAHPELQPDSGTLYKDSHWTHRCAETVERVALDLLAIRRRTVAALLMAIKCKRRLVIIGFIHDSC